MQIAINKHLLPFEFYFHRRKLLAENRVGVVAEVLRHLIESIWRNRPGSLEDYLRVTLKDMKDSEWIAGYDFLRVGILVLISIRALDGKTHMLRYRLDPIKKR